MSEPEHLRVTYNDVHKLIQTSAERIAEFKPDILIAIGEYPRYVLIPGHEWTHVFSSAQVEGECLLVSDMTVVAS